MAEVDQNGSWSDYIYANGQKIAKVVSAKPILNLHGMRDNTINMGCGVEGPLQGGGGAGLVIAAGDILAYDFKQTLPSYGGLALILDNGSLGAGDLTDTITGTQIWFDSASDGQWRHLTAHLDKYAGHTLTYAYLGIHNSMPAGTFDMWLANIVIVHADGSATSIYNGQPASVGGFSGTQCGGHNLSSGTAVTPMTDSTVSTTFYLADQLGSAQVELSAGGWPLWTGQFTPFGQEIVAGQTIVPGNKDGTSMPFKFTGKERDAESGLDYFGARYYSSVIGRFSSPDWSSVPQPVPFANLANPQSLNLYSYVGNNPLSVTDPFGHNWFTDFLNGVANATYRPLVTAVQHPIITGRAVGNAVAHPIATAHALRNGVVTTSQQVMTGNGTAIGTALGTAGMVFVPGVGEVGEAAEGTADLAKVGEAADAAEAGANYAGENVVQGSGRVNSDLPGGQQAAGSKFNDLTNGQGTSVDPKTGHTVADDGTRLRNNTNGTARIDRPASVTGGQHETIHYNNPD